jgi:ABC-2 type transport system permease protein
VLGLVLAIASNALLQVSVFMRWLTPFTVFFMVFGITALGIGMGAAFPNFRAENLAQVATGFGGLLYMLTAMSFIALVIVLEAGPVYTLFMAEARGRPLGMPQWLYIGGSFVLVLVVNVAAVWLPMSYGIRRLSTFEG